MPGVGSHLPVVGARLDGDAHHARLLVDPVAALEVVEHLGLGGERVGRGGRWGGEADGGLCCGRRRRTRRARRRRVARAIICRVTPLLALGSGLHRCVISCPLVVYLAQ